jgi:hypothetical protein
MLGCRVSSHARRRLRFGNMQPRREVPSRNVWPNFISPAASSAAACALIEKRVPPMRREGAAVEASAASGAVASVALRRHRATHSAPTGGVKPDRKIRWIKPETGAVLCHRAPNHVDGGSAGRFAWHSLR